jgi:hypothetical protein
MAKRSRSRSMKSKKLNPFAAHVKKTAKKTGLYGPALFKAAKKSYKKTSKK